MSCLPYSSITLKSVNIEQGDFSVLNNMNDLITSGVVDLIKSDDRLQKYCKSVLVEFPYYDREYLSTYYTFFSRKFRSYPKECCRLLFFSTRLNTPDNVLNEAEDVLLQINNENFLGFATIIPTNGKTQISRVVVKAAPVDEDDSIKGYNLIKYRTKVHCLGKELIVDGFESLKQVGPCVCGHAAFWGIASHHSQWRGYSSMSAGEIDKILRQDVANGVTTGVTADQLSQLISKSGSMPIMRSINSIGQQNLLYEIFAYLDSRIPVLLLFENALHVVVAVGIDKFSISQNDVDREALPLLNENADDNLCASAPSDIELMDQKKCDIITERLFADRVKDIIIIDDNNFSYTKLKFTAKRCHSVSDSAEVVCGGHERRELTMLGISGFIVPMYPRINLQYRHVIALLNRLLLASIHRSQSHTFAASDNLDIEEKLILHLSMDKLCDIRVFLTSSNSYKEYLIDEEQHQMGQSCAAELRNMRFRIMPKMIWCAEFLDRKDFHVLGNILFDTTSNADEGYERMIVCTLGKYGACDVKQLMECSDIKIDNLCINRFQYRE